MKEPVIRTLLIDDDEDEFVLVQDSLEKAGAGGPAIRLRWEPDFDKALQAMLRHEHDVYLVDYRLGDRTGLDLLTEARSHGAVPAVIMLTGTSGDELDQAALKAGVFDYLVKGEFSDREIRRSIRYAYERSLIETELRGHSQILANVHDGVCLLNPKGVVMTWNRGAESLFGYTAAEMTGKPMLTLIAPSDRSRFLERSGLGHGDPGATDLMEFTCMGQHRTGEPIFLAVRASLLRNEAGVLEGAIVCANNVTKQKQLEQLVLTISENEQRRIGQDLHDDLCQQLAGIACLTKLVERRVAEADPECGEELERICGMVSRASSRAREIARGLVPAKLASEGLISALQEIAEQTSRAFRVHCVFAGEPVLGAIDTQVASHLYRIMQEAVGNAVRHGQAQEILATLRREGDRLLLTVQDDGRGMVLRDTLKAGSGLGISTMTHRARMLSGDLTITSEPGKGVRVCCSIPFPGR